MNVAEFLLRLMPVCDVSLVLYYILFISYASWESLIFLLEIFKNIETQTRTPIASRTNVKAMCECNHDILLRDKENFCALKHKAHVNM